jgi:hypothetical protein
MECFVFTSKNFPKAIDFLLSGESESIQRTLRLLILGDNAKLVLARETLASHGIEVAIFADIFTIRKASQIGSPGCRRELSSGTGLVFQPLMERSRKCN